jgi:hypothetical protein
MIVTIKCGKNDTFSKENNDWKGEEEQMVGLTVGNMLQ